jgi:dTDP-4-amino-4,6-dideoxyglucose
LNKQGIEELALFGGRPLFDDHVRPIGQLFAGNKDCFLLMAKDILQRKRLTNNGPAVRKLEEELATWHQVDECVCMANASLAIILLITLLAEGKTGEVIMPAFTYPGLPHLAQWAGQKPVFADIHPSKHVLDPSSVELSITKDTTMILGVHQVNSPVDIESMENLSRKYHIPVFYDSVHGAGCEFQGQKLGGFGEAEVFSLHATKLINGFEGGYVTTNNKLLAQRLREARNFGFSGSPASVEFLGYNAKLNELHAAMAICSLKQVDSVIDENKVRYLAYKRAFNETPHVEIVQYDLKQANNFEFVLLEMKAGFPLPRDIVVELLRCENALARAYYSPPLHQSEHAPKSCREVSLPVSETCSKKYIQMPVGSMVSVNDIEHLANFFTFIISNADLIKDRINQLSEEDEYAIAR